MVKFEDSLREGIHHKLKSIEGSWEGTTKTWFEPDILSDESPMKGTMKSILNGRFLLHEYQGTLQNKPFDGIHIFGFRMYDETFQSAWIDSFHMGTGIMLSEGKYDGKSFNGKGFYGGPGIDEPWGWRTELEIISEDQIILTAWNVSPEGEEAKATETIYTRVK